MQVRVEVRLVLPVMVASRDLPKGHEIQPQDLQGKEMEIHRLFRDFTVTPSTLLARKTTRRIRAGQILTPDQLQAQILVKKGDIVVIRAGSSDFSASMQGIAQQDGTQGDGVKVKNSSSGKIIQGWVIEKGIVETRY
jgi:flagella basal body P-ring formation protein FlgA